MPLLRNHCGSQTFSGKTKPSALRFRRALPGEHTYLPAANHFSFLRRRGKRTNVAVQVRMFLAKRKARRMRLEVSSAGLLQALQRGFALRRVRAAAISEIHGRLWQAALGTLRGRILQASSKGSFVAGDSKIDRSNRNVSEHPRLRFIVRCGSRHHHKQRSREREREKRYAAGVIP